MSHKENVRSGPTHKRATLEDTGPDAYVGVLSSPGPLSRRCICVSGAGVSKNLDSRVARPATTLARRARGVAVAHTTWCADSVAEEGTGPVASSRRHVLASPSLGEAWCAKASNRTLARRVYQASTGTAAQTGYQPSVYNRQRLHSV